MVYVHDRSVVHGTGAHGVAGRAGPFLSCGDSLVADGVWWRRAIAACCQPVDRLTSHYRLCLNFHKMQNAGITQCILVCLRMPWSTNILFNTTICSPNCSCA